MPKNITVIKASGDKEVFDPQKVINSLSRSGADKREIKEVLKVLYPQLQNGMTTKEIYRLVFETLRNLDENANSVAGRYSLKNAIAELGPTGYPFEKFFGGVLAKSGYEVETNLIIQGECVSHEVDVLAKKVVDGKVIETNIIEAKFHKRYGFKTNIKTALYVYARYLDLKPNIRDNPKIWLATNTKVTSEVKKYAMCKNFKITSWNYPDGESLRELVDRTKLHPITALPSLDNLTKETLIRNEIVFIQDLKKAEILFPASSRFKQLVAEAERMMKL